MSLSAAETLPYNFPLYIAYYVIAVNFWTFVLFGWDKMRAESGGWRIPEGTLLFWAFAGGTPAAYAARLAFRHKKRKQPFTGSLHTIAAIQMMFAALVIAYILIGVPGPGR